MGGSAQWEWHCECLRVHTKRILKGTIVPRNVRSTAELYRCLQDRAYAYQEVFLYFRKLPLKPSAHDSIHKSGTKAVSRNNKQKYILIFEKMK